MKKYISKLHYLTQDLPEKTHVQQAMEALEAGANWVQYRCLTKDEPALLEDLHQIAALCDDWGATLIVTDHIGLLQKADIQGVHIEDMQADFAAIRQAIGPDKTLGASANSIAQIRRAAQSGVVDYVGCGPFRITHTKPNTYPLLGLEGYRAIVAGMKQEAIDIPLLAVGGIAIDDIDALLETGVYGVAVSAAVNLADNSGRALKEIYKKIY